MKQEISTRIHQILNKLYIYCVDESVENNGEKSKLDNCGGCATVGGNGRCLKTCWTKLQDRNNEYGCQSCSRNDSSMVK